jgi:hypothetical protein
MKDALSQAKQEYERALSAKNQEMLTILNSDRDRFHMNPAWQELYYSHPVAKYAPKLAKLLNVFQDAHPTAATERLLTVVALAVARGAAVLKAQADKAAQPKRGQGRSVSAPERIENDQVVAAVTEIAQGFKAQIKAQFVAYYRNGIEDYLKKCAELKMTNPHNIYPTDGQISRWQYASAVHQRQRITPFLDSVSVSFVELATMIHLTPYQRSTEQVRYSVKPNAEELVEKRAETEAETAVQSFIGKMTGKLKGILDQKGDFQSVTVQGSLGSNSMLFQFMDGSCFTVTNDIIINHSVHGLPFNQYPTRFSRVNLRPGTQMSWGLEAISEAWMKKNFK